MPLEIAPTDLRGSIAVRRLNYCLSQHPLGFNARAAIERVKRAYESDLSPWIVGYSGGKDSSAVLKILFHAIRLAEFHHKLVNVVYCDTGVEIPVASDLANNVMIEYQREAQALGLPISTTVLRPRMEDRFFVKVIGRGYPPPTDKFRWCTDRLRINPVSRFLKSVDARDAVVILGVRADESATRALTLKQNATDDKYWRKQRGCSDRRLFMPILDLKLADVWHLLLHLPTPVSVRGADVADLYSSAAGECPTIRDPVSPPCGQARFGCWTCTVAKKSQTLENLVLSGKKSYSCLHEYRAWLATSRNDPQYRWKRRRNGNLGLGPMTMQWRRMAMDRLLKAQRAFGGKLIDEEEIRAIRGYWENDSRGN